MVNTSRKRALITWTHFWPKSFFCEKCELSILLRRNRGSSFNSLAVYGFNRISQKQTLLKKFSLKKSSAPQAQQIWTVVNRCCCNYWNISRCKRWLIMMSNTEYIPILLTIYQLSCLFVLLHGRESCRTSRLRSSPVVFIVFGWPYFLIKTAKSDALMMLLLPNVNWLAFHGVDLYCWTLHFSHIVHSCLPSSLLNSWQKTSECGNVTFPKEFELRS